MALMIIDEEQFKKDYGFDFCKLSTLKYPREFLSKKELEEFDELLKYEKENLSEEEFNKVLDTEASLYLKEKKKELLSKNFDYSNLIFKH